jgi:hypothetical protein
LGYWLVEASDRRGAQWGFLVEADRKPIVFGIVGRMKSLGRIIELSGQTVEVARLDLASVRVGRRADTWPRNVPRYSLEGEEI